MIEELCYYKPVDSGRNLQEVCDQFACDPLTAAVRMAQAPEGHIVLVDTPALWDSYGWRCARKHPTHPRLVAVFFTKPEFFAQFRSNWYCNGCGHLLSNCMEHPRDGD